MKINSPDQENGIYFFCYFQNLSSPDLEKTSVFGDYYLFGEKPLAAFYVHNGQSHTYLSICMGKFIREQRVKSAIVFYRVEKEYSTVKKQLTTEVDSKKTTIGNLSKELEIHQKNFIELKEELSKVFIVFFYRLMYKPSLYIY